MLDLVNSNLKTGINGLDASLVDVPGARARSDEVQNVPHGETHIRTYQSKIAGSSRALYTYVPPQYDDEARRRFPVLSLRHGFGDLESNWSIDGRAGGILHNLIAKPKAPPLLIVMNDGTDLTWAGGSCGEGIDKLRRALLTEVIPFVEKHYRTLPGRENQAINGLSLGGGQAFTIGLRHLDSFACVGMMGANKKLCLLFLRCGKEDAQEWNVWRHPLAEMTQSAGCLR